MLLLESERNDEMSDFTDAEDRQLVQLAREFSRNGRHIVWKQLTEQMRGTTKPQEALRQRLKTLKRTHGRQLKNFPRRFVKDVAVAAKPPRRPKLSPNTATRDNKKLPLRPNERYATQGNMTFETE
jgi:hypothetical protein